MIDRLKVKRTIVIEYSIIPTFESSINDLKSKEDDLSIEDITSMLRFIGPDIIMNSTVEFEEIYDLPE